MEWYSFDARIGAALINWLTNSVSNVLVLTYHYSVFCVGITIRKQLAFATQYWHAYMKQLLWNTIIMHSMINAMNYGLLYFFIPMTVTFKGVVYSSFTLSHVLSSLLCVDHGSWKSVKTWSWMWGCTPPIPAEEVISLSSAWAIYNLMRSCLKEGIGVQGL